MYEWWTCECDRLNEGYLFIGTVYQKGYFTNAIDSFTNQILGHRVQITHVVKIKWKDTLNWDLI